MLSASTNEATKAIGEVAADFSEISIDTLIESDIVKELPVVKTILAFPKVIKGISNYLLAQKIIRFLYQLGRTTVEERQKFLKSLDGNKKKEILSNLILVLDKHDHIRKADLQGKLFGAYIRGELSYQEYAELTYSLNMLDISTLASLIDFYTKDPVPTLPPEHIYNFIFLKLIRVDNSLIGTWGGGGPVNKRNRLGMLFVEVSTEANIPQKYADEVIGKTQKSNEKLP